MSRLRTREKRKSFLANGPIYFERRAKCANFAAGICLLYLALHSRFLPRNAMHSADYRKISVCPSHAGILS